jgi:hypothetical protein
MGTMEHRDDPGRVWQARGFIGKVAAPALDRPPSAAAGHLCVGGGA